MEYYNNYYAGLFWIPKNGDSKTTAILHIDNDGNVTISSFQPLTNNQEKIITFQKWDKIKVLFGYINCQNTLKTYSVKLYEVFQIHKSYGTLTKFKYQSSNSFISPKFDNEIRTVIF